MNELLTSALFNISHLFKVFIAYILSLDFMRTTVTYKGKFDRKVHVLCWREEYKLGRKTLFPTKIKDSYFSKCSFTNQGKGIEIFSAQTKSFNLRRYRLHCNEHITTHTSTTKLAGNYRS